MSQDADKRRSWLECAVALLLLTWKQNEQRSETVFELLEKKWKTSCRKKSGRHRNENVRTSLMRVELTSTRARWIPSMDRANWIASEDSLHAVRSRISQHFSADRVAVVHMCRIAVHESFGNLHEDVQRNDSAGVIPRTYNYTSRLLYEEHEWPTRPSYDSCSSLLYRVQTGIRTAVIAADRSTNAI